ncbi:MAG: hypothetical protein ACFFAS_07040 [Promethearchaeota archaeon]
MSYSLWQARIKVPMIQGVFIGLFAITIFLMDFVIARWFYEVGFFNKEQFYGYRYMYDIIIGLICFYILVNIRINNLHHNPIWKFIIISNLPNLVLCWIWTKTMKDLTELVESVKKENIESLTFDLMYKVLYFEIWKEKMLFR